ncbi:MAG: peptidylprolyl isomerase [Proteobacteria bacterium]|nr:peptidylprolyl isomerase [Pseudomonadota bacterium]
MPRTYLLIYLLLFTLSPVVKAADKQAHVVIETQYGNIEMQLLPYVAPNHVKNFIKLASSGFYDGTIFHRVIPGFMVQGGDPNTRGKDKSSYGSGGPGYTIAAEFNNQPHVRGTVSMARAGDPDSAGSQFFIVVKNSRFLDKKYTVFARVIKGMEVVDEIVSQKRDKNDNPRERVEMLVQIVNESVLKKTLTGQ